MTNRSSLAVYLVMVLGPRDELVLSGQLGAGISPAPHSAPYEVSTSKVRSTSLEWTTSCAPCGAGWQTPRDEIRPRPLGPSEPGST